MANRHLVRKAPNWVPQLRRRSQCPCATTGETTAQIATWSKEICVPERERCHNANLGKLIMQARLSCLAAAGACALLFALPAGPSIAQSQPAAPAQPVQGQAPAKEAAPSQAAVAPAPAKVETPAQLAAPPQPVQAEAPAKDAAPVQAAAASAPARAETLAQPAAPAQVAAKDADKDLVGFDVFGSEGQQIGKVSKVDQSNGKLSSIVVVSKGFHGFFKKTYVVPADAIKTKAGRIDLSITSERVAQLKQ